MHKFLKVLRLAFFLVLIIGASYLILQNENLEQFLSLKSWESEKPWFFLIAALAFFTGVSAKTVRFYLITQSAKHKEARKKKKLALQKNKGKTQPSANSDISDVIPMPGIKNANEKKRHILQVIMFSYCISYFILSSGIIIKAAALKEQYGQKLFTTLTQVVLEKILSLFLIVPFFFSFSYLLLGYSMNEFQYFNLLITVFIVLCSAVISIAFRKPLFLFFLRLATKLPSVAKWKLKKTFVHVHKSFGLIENPTSLIIAILLTVIIWTSESALFFSVFQAMGFTFTFFESVFAFLLVFFGVNLLPIAIVGIGVFEASMLLFGSLIGYEGNLFTIAVQLHGIQILLYGVLLIALMLLLRMDFFSLVNLFKKAYKKKPHTT